MGTKPPPRPAVRTDRWTPVFERLVIDMSLTAQELRVWLYLCLHNLPDSRNGGRRKGYVFVSRSAISRVFGCTQRQAGRMLASLEVKGLIRREEQPGKTSRIHLAVDMFPDSQTLDAECPRYEVTIVSSF